MKASVTVSILLIILISCQNESVNPTITGANPIRITHYDEATGNKLLEINYQYSDGKLVRETLTDIAEGINNSETNYEFDDNGYVTMRREYLDVYKTALVHHFEYSDGRLSKDSSFYEFSPQWWSMKLFFYGSDNLTDSIQLFQPMVGRDVLYAGTSLYSYDNDNRVTLEKYTLHDGNAPSTISEYTYGNSLVTKCSESNCFITELNASGQVVKFTMNQRIIEEYFYTNNILTEKKLYRYATYDAGNTPTGVTLAKYEY